MRLKTKTRIANISIWVIVITLVIITLFFFGYLISDTFNLKVFASNTTDFIWILFAASLVIVICGALLNISLNIGIIADRRTGETDDRLPDRKKFNLRILLLLLLTMAVIVAFLFFGDYRSRKREEVMIRAAASEMLDRYQKSINELAYFLEDSSRVGSIPDILNFLCNQKSEFPSIVLITSDYYNGQITYLKISEFTKPESLKLPFYNSSFHPCNENDCDYLQQIFTGDDMDTLFWSEGSRYYLYIPFDQGAVKFVLLFSDYDRYGKIGS